MPKFRIGTVGAGIDKNKLDNFTGIKISANYTCNNCWAKRLCRGCGSCYNLNYFSNKSLGKPDPYYCELFRYKTKLMMAMLAKIAEKDSRLLDKVFIPEYYATRGRKNKIKK
jgi:sulfatase maturation enzyme AslB (radical SAM superfamily)